MSQTRKKRRERSAAEMFAEVESNLNLPEVVEALSGEALAAEREALQAAELAAEQEALIAATQESESRPDILELKNVFHLKRVIESLLFASDRPLTVSSLRQLIGGEIGRKEVQDCLDGLVADFSDRGIVLHDVAGGYQFRTHPSASSWIQKLIAGRPVRLSRAQLDTLAIVAYRQPITRPEIDDIRGVDSGSTLKVLLDRSLIRVLGKKEEAGRPLLYGTTKDFLEFFNLPELRDLPTLREFHELNDEGMAQVDKLGADIKGVDVGAVAAEVAAERAAEEEATRLAADALVEEKRLAKEAAKAEKLIAAQEARPADDEDLLSDEPDEHADATDDLGDDEDFGGESAPLSDVLNREIGPEIDDDGSSASAEDDHHNKAETGLETRFEGLRSVPLQEEPKDEEEVWDDEQEVAPMTAKSDESMGDERDQQETTMPEGIGAEVAMDPDTIMETNPRMTRLSTEPMAESIDATLVDRAPIPDDLDDSDDATLGDFGERTEIDNLPPLRDHQPDQDLATPRGLPLERHPDEPAVSSETSD